MKMTVRTPADAPDVRADLLVVPLATGDGAADGPAHQVDVALGGAVGACLADREMTGAAGTVTVLHAGDRLRAPRVALVGVGDGDPEGWRSAGRAVGARARALGARTVAVLAADAPAAQVTAMAAGIAHGNYRYTRFLTPDDDARPPMNTLRIHATDLPKARLARTADIARAVELARDLGNAPSNVLTPVELAAQARALAEATPGLQCRVIGERELTRMKAGALLAVAQGSAQPPRMIVMRYTPAAPATDEVLGLVGKAVTFDTGGVSIKPASGMEEMKLDMAGGAAVIAAMGAIARQAPAVSVVGVVASAENMVSGTAMKPGDVVRAMNGRTIEVLNTDAEGRLCLADALCYATSRAGATRLIDLATLTGSIVATFGEGVYTGLFGGDPDWTEAVRSAGDTAGEPCWVMPMHPAYRSYHSSTVADLANNSKKRWAGAISAAMFLREFTDGRPWCHLDIAGTGMVGGAATGWGVELLLEVAEALARG